MGAETRRVLRERFGFACGYCGVSEDDVGALLTTDHFQLRAHGDADETDNLVYACHTCHEFKGESWPSDDTLRVLHPLSDDLTQHIAPKSNGTLRDLTPTGTFHIERLRLNRPALVKHRRARQRLAAAQARQRTLLVRLERLEEQVEELSARLENLDREENHNSD